jgi:hypothetical protein
MRFNIRFAMVLFATLVATTAYAQSPARLEPFGLEGKVVTTLGIYGSLYAGTDGDGVFKRSIFYNDTGWVSLGLEGKKIWSVYPHKYGPLGFATSAGIEPQRGNPDSVLIYCSIFDQPEWAVTDSGMNRQEVAAIRSLDGFPDPTICGETFAASIGSSAGVWRRGFINRRWEKVLEIGVGIANVVRADERSGNVWAGGETGIFAPWIAKSTDQGDHWEISYPDLAGDNACNSIAIHPTNSDVAYAGMEGAVIKTTDGGKMWTYSGLRDTQAYIYGLALDAASPAHIFAGGLIANPSSWALWESFDAGETWQEIPPADMGMMSLAITGISSIVADPSRAGVIYIATFGHGVWKYESLTTGVDDPSESFLPLQYKLEQNYPNPFNPETTIRFEIPAALDPSPVQLTIVDVRGVLVRTLVDRELNAGSHSVKWDGINENGQLVASGVYFCRLQVGNVRQVRKLSLLR